MRVEVISYQPGNITPDSHEVTMQKLEILLKTVGFQTVWPTPKHLRADNAEMGSIYAEVKHET